MLDDTAQFAGEGCHHIVDIAAGKVRHKRLCDLCIVGFLAAGECLYVFLGDDAHLFEHCQPIDTHHRLLTVDGVGDKAGIVQLSQRICQTAADARALRPGQFFNFVADAVKGYTGVVVVFGYHGLQVLLPLGFKAGGIVMRCLAVQPCVEGLLPHQHPQSVTGLQHGLGHGVVSHAQRIEAGFLTQRYPPPFCVGKGGRAQDAVVVMDTAPSQQERLSVQPQAMQRVKLKLTDAKGALCAVHRLIATQQGHMAGVKLRVLRRPQGGVPQIDTAGDIGIFPGEQRHGTMAFVHGLPLPVLYHHLHGERFILPVPMPDLHLQPDGADGLFHLGCVNAQPLGQNMGLPPGIQPHRAIQPGAAVPA